ncbi:MAG: hypothetical protein EXQ87_01210 [Alphaproteobacteria bacterium]|nr:hypothetical protein [Alphaproteobacteria bacterium]
MFAALVTALALSMAAPAGAQGDWPNRNVTLKLLAMYSPIRHPDFPDVPTLAETGWGQIDVPIWFGFFVPRGTPEAITAKLNAATVKISSTPEMKERLMQIGFLATTETIEETQAIMRKGGALIAGLIKEAKISVE